MNKPRMTGISKAADGDGNNGNSSDSFMRFLPMRNAVVRTEAIGVLV